MKKDGGLRPIAVGLTLRRLAAKVVATHATSKLQSLFSPVQLGVGVARGLEAGVHAARVFTDSLPSGHALVKIDFANAFNCIRRDTVLEAVDRALPSVYPFAFSSYARDSVLFFGNDKLMSTEGVQQGDPLGPLLFCLTTLPLLTSCAAQLKFGYLDDFTLGGELPVLVKEIDKLRTNALPLGLSLNDSKCEIICPVADVSGIPTELSQFVHIVPQEASLLGVPLSTGAALSSAIEKNVTSLELVASRLLALHKQDALLILRYSFSTPCIQHLLRGIFCGDSPLLSQYDVKMRSMLQGILNTQLDDMAWQQATLPINAGGLGIRSAVHLSASAFLASVHGADALVSHLVAGNHSMLQDPLVYRASQFWSGLVGATVISTPPGPLSLQKSWDKPVITAVYDSLLASATDDYSKARLRAVASPHAGDWLKTIPSPSLGLRLDDEGMRIAVGLRIGANLCMPFVCACGAQVDARGAHGLSCVKSAGRQLRHSLVNSEVLRAFSRAGVPATREPTGLIPGSSLRPDGATVIPWSHGRCLTWDVTCPDTVAASHVTSSASAAGSAAEHAANLKTQKYQQLTTSHSFVPIAMETLGAINAGGLELLITLGGRCIAATGDPRERMFLFQRLSLAVQRGNIACFTGALHQECFFLDASAA
jgi:Reverse transcriptase (RNA-dependent DNA polymerase)